MKAICRSSRAAHAWMRSGDISLRVCVALSILVMLRATPTSVGQSDVGNQSPHVAWLFTWGKNGRLHAWKAGFTGHGWDYGRGCCRALIPSTGRKPEVFAHDQYPSRETAFPTSHAGTRVSLLRNSFIRGMGAPEIFQSKVKF
jgi:hypothetical protein